MYRSLHHRVTKAVLPVFVLFASGCGLLTGPDCINEDRSVSAEAHLVNVISATADTGRAFITLSEARNFRTKRTASLGVIYFASSTLPRASVTGVHVHANSDNAVLYSFPLTPVGPDFVITQNFTNAEFPSTGGTTFDDIFNKVVGGQAYVDVHTEQAAPRLRGPLVNRNPGNTGWVHAYCS